MSDRHLPVRPDLGQLKRQAKELLSAFRSHEPGALAQGRAERASAEDRHADASGVTSGGEATAVAVAPAPPVDAMDTGGADQVWIAREAEEADWGAEGAGDSAEMAPMAPDMASRAGCASCTVGAEVPTPRALWLTLPLLGLFFWRRRR